MVLDRGPRGYRRVVVAAVGYLSASLPLLANQRPPYPDELPDLRGIVVGSPAIEAGRGGKRWDDDRQPESPIQPSPSIKNQAQAPSTGDGTDDAKRREEQRAENDLAAQQDMARSARIMLTLTGWQIALGVIGTLAVILALRHSAKATNAAVESNKLNRAMFLADQRPWVAVTAELNAPIRWIAKGIVSEIRFVLENTGRTPALNADIRVRTVPYCGERDLLKDQANLCSGFRASRGGHGTAVFPQERLQQDIPIAVENGILNYLRQTEKRESLDDLGLYLAVVGCVEYSSVASNRRHQTGFIFRIVDTSLNGRPVLIYRDLGDVPPQDVRLLPWRHRGRIN